MDDKTNVTRILDQKKIKYTYYTFDTDKALSAEEVALKINKSATNVYKTLVTIGKSNKNYCFVVPALKELDLKKAASSINEKYIEMIHQKELLPLTGYVHGGCSPIGMKKILPTVIDISAEKLDSIIVSAGRIGAQIELSLNDLRKVINIKSFDITK